MKTVRILLITAFTAALFFVLASESYGATQKAKVGDIVTMGSYYYSKDGEEKRPVEWIVAGEPHDFFGEENAYILISRDIIDTVELDPGKHSFYGNLNLRRWLNTTFLNNCFSAAEQRLLLGNPVGEPNPNATCSADAQRSTGDSDKVNILSYPWLDGISGNELRKAKATPYAASQHLSAAEGGCSPWLLWMEFSEWDANVNVVDAQGNLLCEKLSKYPALGIRPTIRVSKNALLNVTGRVNIPAFKLANTPKSYSPATRLIRGDIITFGKAEQDGNAKNGKEAIRWIVLDVRDGKALLVSRSILYCWDTSGEGYEEFLNDKFYKNAFSDSEKANIILTENQTDEPDINWGEFSYTISSVRTKKTRDRVFILSDNELGRYFPDNASRYATATAEANKQSYSEYGIENYITRNISWIVCDESAANVSWLYSQHGGAFYTGLRPAIWVKTSAD